MSNKSLPPLHQILQTFSPLQQVTVRSTTFSTITHPSFHLRFADFSSLEAACAEDEDERASRTIDWLGQRITREADKWVKSVESDKIKINHPSDAPWWQELHNCVEGDHLPTRFEGWNHPVAVILAVSTLAPNPLQAVTELHSRYNDVRLPPWVDPVRLCHTVIIHSTTSPLNSDEAMALYNATKKQFGLHTHLVTVTLESPLEPITLPSPLPELPSSPLFDNNKAQEKDSWDLNLNETDTQQLGRFVREFATMSLLPWMERCVLDWNESYIATRRLPSRFFSTTKRFFGNSNTPSSPSSPIQQSASFTNGFSSATLPTSSLPQHRRLAEFATCLGDIKLATSVWETLRKDGKSGAEVLPFLLAPTAALATHATSALASLQTVEFRSSHQLQALYHAVRWASGIKGFDSLDGERWLEMAAGSIEEPPFALLLAQAALFSLRKGARRRAAMWFVFAAHRLEKCGVKSLTAYFLRRAHQLYQSRPAKNLSPSFEDSLLRKDIEWFDAILPSVEYSLGRLTYSSGDTKGALQYFIKLLKGTAYNAGEHDLTDSVYIGDFKVAFEHLKSTVGTKSLDLTPPFKLSQSKECKVRLEQDQSNLTSPVWESLEQAWGDFWKTRGKERLDSGRKASIGERFYVDVTLVNPFDVAIPLSAITLEIDTTIESSAVDKEILDEITLHPRETRVISLYITCHSSGMVKFTHLTYNFLSLSPISESLAVSGPRLHQTIAQRRGVMYGPETFPVIQIQEDRRRLELSMNRISTSLFRKFVLGTGECADLKITFRNAGPGDIDDIWILHSPSLWVDVEQKGSGFVQTHDTVEVLQSDNTLVDLTPSAIPLERYLGSPQLKEGESLEAPCVIHASQKDSQDLFILAIFRQRNQHHFFSSKLHQTFQVQPVIECGVVARPSHRPDISYEVLLEVRNLSEKLDLTIPQVTCASPNWQCVSEGPNMLHTMSPLPALQFGRAFFLVKPSEENNEKSLMVDDMVIDRLGNALLGKQNDSSPFPALDISFSHFSKSEERLSAHTSGHLDLLHHAWRTCSNDKALAQARVLFPKNFHKLLPLWHSRMLNIVIYWEIPEENRRGFVAVPGIALGACSAPLDELIQTSDASSKKRSIYAETSRERTAIQSVIQSLDWNAEMNPLVIQVSTESPRVTHDFSKGECTITVSFVIRNFSLTNYARFTLRLPSHSNTKPSQTRNLAPCYMGALTRRGTVEPRETVTVQARIWATRPGIYDLDEWKLETEVGGKQLEPWSTLGHYVQEVAAKDNNIVIVMQHPL